MRRILYADRRRVRGAPRLIRLQLARRRRQLARRRRKLARRLTRRLRWKILKVSSGMKARRRSGWVWEWRRGGRLRHLLLRHPAHLARLGDVRRGKARVNALWCQLGLRRHEEVRRRHGVAWRRCMTRRTSRWWALRPCHHGRWPAGWGTAGPVHWERER